MSTCPNCKQNYTPELLLPKNEETGKKFRRWQGGELIQNVWPRASATQREQLQTGICSDACWDEYLRVAERGTQ